MLYGHSNKQNTVYVLSGWGSNPEPSALKTSALPIEITIILKIIGLIYKLFKDIHIIILRSVNCNFDSLHNIMLTSILNYVQYTIIVYLSYIIKNRRRDNADFNVHDF